MNHRSLAWIALGAVISSLTIFGGSGCEGRSDVDPAILNASRPKMIDASHLKQVAQTRVLFTHMSVGSNVLSGVRSLLAESGVEWQIVAAETSGSGPALIEATPGRNGDPRSKIDGFVHILRATNPAPDLAVMKLCYTDVVHGTDIDSVLDYYREKVDELKQQLPNVVIGHATVPLSVRPRSTKSKLFRIVGRSVRGDADNARRAEYNARLRTMFARDPIFDLAQVESTRPDGTLETHEATGAIVPALVRAYASDESGHLNDLGQRVAAEAFVAFVAGAMQGGARTSAMDGRGQPATPD